MKKTKIFSIFALLIALMSASVMYSCSSASKEVSPKVTKSVQVRNDKSAPYISNGTFVAPDDIRASSPTDVEEEIFTQGNTTYKLVVRLNSIENKIYDFTLSYVSGDPVDISNTDNPETRAKMTAIQFWVRLIGCLFGSSSNRQIVNCIVGLVTQVMVDCVLYGGEHCWYKR